MTKQVKMGVTKSGIQEKCEWEGPGACPRHQMHSQSMEQSNYGITTDAFLKSLEDNPPAPGESSALSYDVYASFRNASMVGKYSQEELLESGLSADEIYAIKNNPPQNKTPDPIVSQNSQSGQLYNMIQEIRLQDENSVSIDNMKVKYDGIRRIDDMDDARNAFLNEEASKIYNAAWLVESDPDARRKYSKELIDAANEVARYQNNPVGTLPVERTVDGYQLSKKYDNLLTLLKNEQDEIKKEAYVKDPYYKEKPSFTLVNMRAEKAIIDKEIVKLEKQARNPFNAKARSMLKAKRSIQSSISQDLEYYETTNNDTLRNKI